MTETLRCPLATACLQHRCPACGAEPPEEVSALAALRCWVPNARQVSHVRHNETRCTRAHQSGSKQTEALARETVRNKAERNAQTPVNESLDHVIGVRLP